MARDLTSLSGGEDRTKQIDDHRRLLQLELQHFVLFQDYDLTTETSYKIQNRQGHCKEHDGKSKNVDD